MTMTKKMRTHASLLFALALLTLGVGRAEAVVISLVPDSATAVVGTAIDVELQISGLGDGTADSLGAFDIDLVFDPAILLFTGAVFSNQLDVLGLGPSLFQSATSAGGTVNLTDVSFDSAADLNTLQLGAFTLATVSFDPIAAGAVNFGINVIRLGDADGAPLFLDNPTNVPEPAVVFLLAVGLFGLGLGRRRRAS